MKNLESLDNLDCEIFNDNNPYDETGKKHNELLFEIESAGNPEMSSEEVYQLVDKVVGRIMKT